MTATISPLAATIAQAEEVIASGAGWRSNAYVFTREGSHAFGFFFAKNDDAAEEYKTRMQTAECSRWLIVAVVPGQVRV